MTTEQIATLIGVIIALAGSVGFWNYLQFRKEAPIKAKQADLAVATTTQAMALQIAADLRIDLDQLRADFKDEQAARQMLAGRQEGFEAQLREQGETISRLRSLVQAFSYGWDELIADWANLRLRDKPPQKPVSNLHQ